MKNLPVFKMSTYNKYFGEKNNLENWKPFFECFTDRNLKILDFGCGAAWSIYRGRELGYDIQGLDVPMWCFKEFNEFRTALGVDKYVKIYGGAGILPFEDGEFSLVVSRGSFEKLGNNLGMKDEKEIIEQRIMEFGRILSGPRIAVIAGGFFLNYKKVFEASGIKEIYLWTRNRIGRPSWKK